MDFFNHGIKRGLSSPFRFFPAIWAKIMGNDPAPLEAYQEETSLGYVKRLEQAKINAESIITEEASLNADLAMELIRKKGDTLNPPRELAELLAVFAASQEGPMEDKDGKLGNPVQLFKPKEVKWFLQKAFQKEREKREEVACLKRSELSSKIRKRPFFKEFRV